MKIDRSTTLVAFLASALVVLGASSAGALGELDGVWLKVSVSSKGLQILEANTAIRVKGSARATCYMNIRYTEDGGVPFVEPGTYEGRIVCPTAAGGWEQTDTVEGRELADGAWFMDNECPLFGNGDADVLEGCGSFLAEFKTTPAGNPKRVKFRSLGIELIDTSTLDGGLSDFFGTYSVKGRAVPAEKLPSGVAAALL